MKSIHVLLLLSILLFVGCKRTPELSESQRAAITNDVRRVISATVDSINVKGMTGWLSFFHNSPDFTWEYRNNATTYDTLILQIARQAPQYRAVTFRWDSVQVRALAEGEAYVVGNYMQTLVDTAGTSSQTNGTIKSTLLRIGDSWKFIKVQTIPQN